ncbi:cytochrome c family protein [Thalassovita sp.]|uniref:c-type cytochrome n=1 Tax=Thalassovita sp. TaxID=1979401 RepID=UPI002B26F38D|nr:cytochrome c family protein [Thalassovita sp.]
MLDTMTLTKAGGALCGTLLVFLLGNWAAEELYSMEGGHGDHAEQAYVIDTGADEGHGEEAVDEGPSFGELLAEADIAKGAKVFSKCKACHKIEEGQNATGPSLYGVVGRNVGAMDGFGYSGSLVAVADVWTPEHLNDFLTNPKSFAPGTKMSFAGLKKITDRANLVAYLDSLDN